jgi:hypothetical protein
MATNPEIKSQGFEYVDPPLGEVLGRVLRNNIIFQIFLYGTIQNILAAAHRGLIDSIIDEINRRFTPEELTPEQAANAVVQNAWNYDEALQDALAGGISKERFDVLIAMAGNPPGPEALAEALRLGIIPEKGRGPDAISYEQGIAESRLKNKWADVVKKLALRWPTVPEVITAVIKSQIDEKEGFELYKKVGGVPELYKLMIGLHGEAPTPLQAAEMAHRGIIPWEGTGPDVLSFEQAVRESRYRTKWLPAWKKLSEYVPPPRTVVTLYREGSIDREKAAELLRRNGLPPELIEAYLLHASKERTQKARDLAVSQVLLLYNERAIDERKAHELLKRLGYDDEEIGFLLMLEDLQRIRRQREAAINRIRNQYITRRIDKTTATTQLDAIGVPPAQRDELFAIWDSEVEVQVRTLTPAEIRRAMRLGLISPDDAVRKLVDIGYSPEDAGIYLRL